MRKLVSCGAAPSAISTLWAQGGRPSRSSQSSRNPVSTCIEPAIAAAVGVPGEAASESAPAQHGKDRQSHIVSNSRLRGGGSRQQNEADRRPGKKLTLAAA